MQTCSNVGLRLQLRNEVLQKNAVNGEDILRKIETKSILTQRIRKTVGIIKKQNEQRELGELDTNRTYRKNSKKYTFLKAKKKWRTQFAYARKRRHIKD